MYSGIRFDCFAASFIALLPSRHLVTIDPRMNLHIPRLVSLILISFSVSGICTGQTGSVTFYSNKLSAKEVIKDTVVPKGTTGFNGWLFDGDQKLMHAQIGYFATFNLAAGEHQFSVPYHSSHPGTKSLLNLKVEADGHYCVRLFAKYVSASLLLPVAYLDSQIEQVPCQQALQEAGGVKPIEMKRVDPGARTKLDNATSFPARN